MNRLQDLLKPLIEIPHRVLKCSPEHGGSGAEFFLTVFIICVHHVLSAEVAQAMIVAGALRLFLNERMMWVCILTDSE